MSEKDDAAEGKTTSNGSTVLTDATSNGKSSNSPSEATMMAGIADTAIVPEGGSLKESLPSVEVKGALESSTPPPPDVPAKPSLTSPKAVTLSLPADHQSSAAVNPASDPALPETVTVTHPEDTPFPPAPSTTIPAEAGLGVSKVKKKKGHKHTASANIPFIPAAGERSGTKEKDDRVRLGICAMDKKARSKPMAEILSRLDEESFHVVFFGDDVILNKPVEEWPTCDVLIAFYSKGYPLEKAMEYVELRKPFTLNNLRMQRTLMDRRAVYDLLEGSGIDVPRHVYLSRDDYVSGGTGDGLGTRDQEVIEHDDHIEVI